MSLQDITPGPAQLKALVDLCHLYGIAVAFDVVYNHAGGFMGDDQSLYFYDRAADTSDNNQSLYFTNRDWRAAFPSHFGITMFASSSSIVLASTLRNSMSMGSVTTKSVRSCP